VTDVLVLATTRGKIADYVAALFLVYSVIIVLYVLTSLVFSLGVRVPYSRWSDALLGFLRDVSEPYLRIFRRFIPMIGPLDISPIVALIVLNIVGSIVESLIRG
jgi:YggT family protein